MPSPTGFLEESERAGLWDYACPRCYGIVVPSDWRYFALLHAGQVKALCGCGEWSAVERPRAKVAELLRAEVPA